ncbi:MAG: outer membrane lipoprotein-sorting protein [Myxococcota bacterium]|jgi:outer membrane lipoprotein-sorting protein
MKRPFVLASALLLASGLAFAQDEAPPAPAEKPAAAPPVQPAARKLAPSEILAKMEALNNGFADQKMEIRLTVVDVDGSKKSYDMTVLQKGDTKRLVQFTSGEMKGMATLVEDRNSVHVYLPGFKKVRRVAAHNMNQSLAGSDLSSEDMAQVSWAADWNVALEKEDDSSYWLSLTPKSAGTSYSKVQHRVDKKTFMQLETHYFDQGGVEVKRFVNTQPTDFHGVMRNKLITVSDPRTGHRTEMEIKDFVVNQGLKDDLFTVRQLQWGK